MRFGLSVEVLAQMESVFRKYPVIDKVIIYGSRAKGNFREGSDIDITLIGKQVNNETAKKVWLDLDELNLPYLIDLSVFHLLDDEELKDHIHRVGKLLYLRDDDD